MRPAHDDTGVSSAISACWLVAAWQASNGPVHLFLQVTPNAGKISAVCVKSTVPLQMPGVLQHFICFLFCKFYENLHCTHAAFGSESHSLRLMPLIRTVPSADT